MENFKFRHFGRNIIGTKEQFDRYSKLHGDMIKMEGAEVYLDEKHGNVILVTTREWREYFMGRSDKIPSAKEK